MTINYTLKLPVTTTGSSNFDLLFIAKRLVLISTDLYESSNSVGIPQNLATKNHFSSAYILFFNGQME
jgi:hypothetical protein